MLWLLLGCVLGEPELAIEPDEARVGEPGELGPYGAAWLELSAAARVTEVVPVDVVFPTEATLGEPVVPAVRRAPAIVMIHGGFVPPERYRWLGEHWATRGYVTLLPRAELDLAIAQPGNGAVALDALRRQAADDGLLEGLVPPDGPVAVGGHSLGGVMAARQWVDDPALDLLMMMASFPAGADPVEDRRGPVIAVSGTTDGLLAPDEFTERVDRFPDPDVWLVDGLNHFAWTDDVSDGERSRDGRLQGDLDALRSVVLTLLDRALDVSLRGAELDVDAPVEGASQP